MQCYPSPAGYTARAAAAIIGHANLNLPVDKVSYSYNVLYNAFKRLSQGYSAAERAALFHDTAARVYRIDV